MHTRRNDVPLCYVTDIHDKLDEYAKPMIFLTSSFFSFSPLSLEHVIARIPYYTFICLRLSILSLYLLILFLFLFLSLSLFSLLPSFYICTLKFVIGIFSAKSILISFYFQYIFCLTFKKLKTQSTCVHVLDISVLYFQSSLGE